MKIPHQLVQAAAGLASFWRETSPEGARQLVPVPKRRLMTSIYLELRSNSLRRPFRAFRNLALEPRACALGCPAGPLRGPWFRARNYLEGDNIEMSSAQLANDPVKIRWNEYMEEFLEPGAIPLEEVFHME